jgi:hypothetical protein
MKTLTPQCGICKKFYSSKDDDGSGLCKTCRPLNSQPLLKEELVQPGKFGVTNKQLIPVMKQAILEEAIDTLRQLKSTYFYIFERSLKYLKKGEQEYINTHVNNH